MNIEKTQESMNTLEIAKASFPKGNGYISLREEYGSLFYDEDFSDLYSWKGEEEIPPSYLATVTVLQYAEGLSDREAADHVRSRIDWKCLLGVELTYAGFDQSALSRFRARLLKAGVEDRLFELPLKRMKEMGLVKERGSQRTDATHVLSQVRTLNRLELVGETLRQALNEVAKIAQDWLESWIPHEWLNKYGRRVEEPKLSRKSETRDELAKAIGQDGYTLLSAIQHSDAPTQVASLNSVEVLRRVWIQQYYGPGELCEWRKSDDLPPAHLMINSPYDLEAKYSHKRKMTWTGYKVHLTESCDQEAPHLITHVETTPATESDCVTLPTIHNALKKKGLLPATHLLDAGYMNVVNTVNSHEDLNIELIGPVRPDTSWQATQQTGYDISHFLVDWDAESVTCPGGNTSRTWSLSTDKHGDQSIAVRFAKQDCAECPARQLCTRAESDPRGLRLQPSQQLHDSLQSARQEQQSEQFQERYRPRAGIEGTISQATRSLGLRHTRFIGSAKTRLQHLATATAINLSRLFQWWQGIAPETTRTSPLLNLQPLPLS